MARVVVVVGFAVVRVGSVVVVVARTCKGQIEVCMGSAIFSVAIQLGLIAWYRIAPYSVGDFAATGFHAMLSGSFVHGLSDVFFVGVGAVLITVGSGLRMRGVRLYREEGISR